MKTKYILVLSMIVAAAFSRLIPHPWNFTAVGAMALFGGAYLPSKKWSLLAPLAALFVSDLALGFHVTMTFVYGAFLLIGLLGWSLRENTSWPRVGAMTLLSSSLFFVVSNFGVWLLEPYYAKTWEGLVQCFVMAIPFFDNQVLGDLFYVSVLFSAYSFAKRSLPELAVSERP